MKSKRFRSFTLIELVICIAIITVFVSVIRLNMSKKNTDLAVEELNTVYEMVNFAKTDSINTGISTNVIFDSRKNRLEINSKNVKERIFEFKYLKVIDTEHIVFNRNGIVDRGYTISFKISDKVYNMTIRPATSYIDLKEK